MKILVLNYEYPPLGGGAGVITQNISERLAELGHKVTVITTWLKTEKETETRGNLEIIRLKAKRKHLHKSSVSEMLSWISESKKFLKTHCTEGMFDLCFANFAIPGGLVALWLKKKFKLKFCIISHGHDIPWMFRQQMRLFHLVLYTRIKMICTESEANFMQTEAMKKNIDKFLGEAQAAKNVLIPNGIDTRLFKPDYAKRDALFKIVFTGRLVEQKDPFTFLNAVNLFAKKNKNFIVHISGEGVLRQGMEKYVSANGLNEYVKFLGWITKQEMVREYQSAHVHIVTSVFEGMSVALLESLACGCFLITTPLSGTDKVITQGVNAVIVNYNSAGEIAKQLEDYHNTKYLQGYKTDDAILNELNHRYNWDTIVLEYEKKFMQLSGIN